MEPTGKSFGLCLHSIPWSQNLFVSTAIQDFPTASSQWWAAAGASCLSLLLFPHSFVFHIIEPSFQTQSKSLLLPFCQPSKASSDTYNQIQSPHHVLHILLIWLWLPVQPHLLFPLVTEFQPSWPPYYSQTFALFNLLCSEHFPPRQPLGLFPYFRQVCSLFLPPQRGLSWPTCQHIYSLLLLYFSTWCLTSYYIFVYCVPFNTGL